MKPDSTQRIHSLDALRAIMMLLGIVLHSCMPYMVTDIGASRDLNAMHISNDVIAALIHMFRMPVFFLIAGFFGALLFYERGFIEMLKNRTSRVLYPFVVFLLLMYPIVTFSRKYEKAVFAGSEQAVEAAASYFPNFLTFLPHSILHLWFLYYLILFIIISSQLALIFKKLPQLSLHISSTFNWIIQKPVIRVFIFATMTSLLYLIMGGSSLPTPDSFMPTRSTFLFYFYFYIIGWVLYKSKHLLDHLKQLDWLCIILGLVVFIISIAINDLKLVDISPYQEISKILFQSLIVWLFIFGIMGLFIRYKSEHSARMRYISDASYWVYLVHFPFTIFIPALLFHWNIHGTLKFLIVMTSTSIISFVTYHSFVRSSFIGQFLNGRKYTKKLSDINK
ncbi:MAG: acyltransferase family protein [Aureispira sp.]